MAGSNLEDRAASLSAAKKALLEVKLRQRSGELRDRRVIRRSTNRDPAPLSFAQRRLWFLIQVEPDSDAYHESSAFRVRGSLDLRALQAAVDQLAARHEIFRTRIIVADDVPLQVVDDHPEIPVLLTDLQSAPPTERDSTIRWHIETAIRQPFDPATDHLLRIRVFRLNDEEHIVVTVKHHLVTDGWSSDIFWRELAAFYHEAITGRDAGLPELPLQYRDYARWQHEYLQGEVLQTQLAYWKKQLEGLPALKLPADGYAVDQHVGAATHTIFLPGELSASLAALSREQNTTLFMILLAAFQILLGRYAGREDFAVGSPIAGRTRVELEGLIGFFVNTLVLRVDLSGDPTFLQLLARVREVCLGAYDHQDIPFEKLVAELNPERTQMQPLFQVMFAFRNTPRRGIDLAGLSVSEVETGQRTSKFDLSLGVYEGTEGLKCVFEYNAGLYSPDMIERMAVGFRVLLEAAVADPRQAVSALPIMSAPGRDQLVFDWNDTRRRYPDNEYAHQLFEKQVDKTPDAIAVEFQGRQLTFRDLNARANRLSWYLMKSGVGPEVLVALCVDRSPEMIVGMMAILKAGGAYVPIDPHYPKDWIRFALEDACVPVLLTESHLLPNLPNIGGAIFCIDAMDNELALSGSEKNPDVRIAAENLAYVIYTSGSTGRPKGVDIPHRALANYINFSIERFALAPGDRILQFASASFDTALEEIFPTLAAGAAIVLRTEEMLGSVEYFLTCCRDLRITVLDLPTAYWHELVDKIASPRMLPETLRLVLIGGEPALPERLAAWREIAGGRVRLLNGYGPTECTIAATFWDAGESPSSDAPKRAVPIGRPIPNVQVYILDGHLNIVPVGVAGELHIGGAGLARGYHRRPELTAEKFIPHPFSAEPEARLYKTGDIACYLPDGNIQFVGRADNQVKIRGYRIELEEIEAVLCRHAGVSDAVVVTRQSASGEPQLIAYFVPAGNSAPSTTEVRHFLLDNLPAPMVPSSLMAIPYLPMTPNGKIDRLSLPTPIPEAADQNRGGEKPNDPVESQLVKIWTDLLSVPSVGVLDDFFELGGHSLLAVQLLHRIEQIFGKKISLAGLLKKPTIRQVAKLLVEQHSAEFDQPLVEIQSGRGKNPFFFLHGDYGGRGIYSFALARELGEDQPVYVLNPLDVDGQGPMTIEDRARVYIEMIRAVQPEGPYLLGGYCNGGILAFEMARQLKREKQAVNLVAIISARLRRNPGIRIVHRCIAAFAYLRGLEPKSKTRLFCRAVELYLYYRNRLKQVGSLPLKDKAAWILHLLKGEFLRIPTYTSVAEAHKINPLTATGFTLEAYVPGKYSGKVVLFEPSSQIGPEDAAAAGWRRVADELDVQPVPGDHLSCVSIHVKTLGALLKTSLFKASTQTSVGLCAFASYLGLLLDNLTI